MDYDQIEQLRIHHPAWRLLKADNAALVLAFLGQVFVNENVRSIERTALETRLDDLLFALREHLGDDAFPKTSRAYLDDWAAPGNAWLRKYYPAGSEAVHFDASADLEKAVAWVHNLPARSFVGTESRLNTVFELLRQMVHGAETDPQTRLAELRARRAEIDAEIARVEAGDLPMMEPAGLRDRYQQLSATARELLSDFRQVESNFRQLDRQLREQIATWSGTKAGLLDEVLGSRTSITESDQGRSFHAFYDFLLSPARQEQFVDMLTGCRRWSRSANTTRGYGTSTMTGWPPASAPSRRCGSCRSSCGVFWTIGSGWRTGGWSTCCTASNPSPCSCASMRRSPSRARSTQCAADRPADGETPVPSRRAFGDRQRPGARGR